VIIIIEGGWYGLGGASLADTQRKNTYFLNEDNNWQALPDMNEKRYLHSCAVLDNTVYVMGGALSGQTPENYKLTAEKYKLGGREWESIDNLPGKLLTSAFVYEDKLYIIIRDGTVYSLIDGTSWDKVTNMDKLTNIDTILDRFSSQILTASSLGC
jgi:hypothetical protein